MPELRRWKASRDPLFRGDSKEAVSLPVPLADPSIVRHVLYLGGAGRETPYLSATESETIAERFVGTDGRVWKTIVARIKASGIQHISRAELLRLLRGRGKGAARWNRPYEVMRARKYVEEHLEHLLDFRRDASSREQTRQKVDEIFEVGRA